MQEIPFWERYMLTIREAAEYFHIGEKKMRQIVEENEGADFIIMNGNRGVTLPQDFGSLFFCGFMGLSMIY